MPDISKIKLPSGTVYAIKDEVARSMVAGGIQLKGTTTTELTDEDTTNPIQIGGESYTAVNQDAVFYGKKEFVFDGTKWHEFGDMSGLGALAKKNSASGPFVPEGDVSQPVTTVTLNTSQKYVASSATGGGSVTAGSPASATMPVFNTSVANETLTISWEDGSFTPNTPTAVELPSFESVQIATGVQSAITTKPAFNGTPGTVSVS